MQTAKYVNCLTLACLAILAFYSSPTIACSCMPTHPQTSFCRADYVVLVRVKGKSTTLQENKAVYKVEIKKSYKMTDEGQNTLKHSRLVTALEDNMCAVNLTLGKLYVIAGQGTQLSSCNYVKEYKDMTIIERRGFAGLYRRACSCEVRPCFGESCLKNVETTTGCKWSPFAKCETDLTLCMRSASLTPNGRIRQCRWKQTPLYKECLLDP